MNIKLKHRLRTREEIMPKSSNRNLILYDLVIQDLVLFLNLILNLQTIISSSDYVYLVNKNFV
jgi:hypothetical protein